MAREPAKPWQRYFLLACVATIKIGAHDNQNQRVLASTGRRSRPAGGRQLPRGSISDRLAARPGWGKLLIRFDETLAAVDHLVNEATITEMSLNGGRG